MIWIKKYKNMSVVTKATLWFMACSIVQKGLSFITTPIFTRIMSQEQYGLYNIYVSWFQILMIIASLRLDYSVFYKGMSEYPEDRDGYASSMLGITSTVTTVMFVVYLLFQKQINSLTELSTLIMCAMFVELYAQTAINFWSLRERYDFRYKAIIIWTLASSVLSSLLGVLVVLSFEESGVVRILVKVLCTLVWGGVAFIILLRRGKKIFDFKYTKFSVLFNLPLIPNYFSTYLIDQSDKIIIQKLVGFEATALYSVAYTIGGLARIFTSALNNTLIPMQYHLLEEKEYKKLNRTMGGIMLSISCMILIITLGGPEINWILGGEEYMEAVYVIPPIAASVFFTFLYNMLENIELFFGKNTFATKISLVSVVINIGLNFLLIPRWGYVAAAYTTMISYFICALGHIIYINVGISSSERDVHVDVKNFLLGVVTTGICILIGSMYRGRVIRFSLVLGVLAIAVWKRKYIIEMVRRIRRG